MESVRTRFAPSPTGHLHVGSVRTALFNYLYARAQGGHFLLRIEDTDRERSKPEYTQAIIDDMAWLGLHYDEPPVAQSARLALYGRHVQTLLEKGLAERVDQETQAVKFKVPHKKMGVEDLIHGRVEFDTALFEDVIIIKSDGMPTYNFACVVDDHEQGITHILRGDDHLSNTPRQWLIYEALGFKPPKVGHIPLITGADRAPLSKRHGQVALGHYIKAGYVPEGLLNYLALLGWSPGGNQEFIGLAEMEKKFRIKAVGRTSATFDEKKCAWLNGRHLKAMPKDAYLTAFRSFLDKQGMLGEHIQPSCGEAVALLFKDRAQTFSELFEAASYCFSESVTLDPGTADVLLTPAARSVMVELAAHLQRLPDFSDEARLEATLRGLAEEKKIKAADVIHPVRFVLTGKTVSPGLFALMRVLGREKTLRRLGAGATYDGKKVQA